MRIRSAARNAALLAVVLGVTLSAATAALAVELPKRKPGLWEVTLQLGNNMPPMVMKMCTDAANDEADFKLGADTSRELCSRRELQRSDDVVTMDLQCKIGATTSTTHAVITFTGDTAYRTVIHSHYDPPRQGRGDSTITQDAKWQSLCPAGMNPGDMIGPNGANIRSAPGAK